MKKTVLACLLSVSIASGVSGCAALSGALRADPVATTQLILSGANTVVEVARVIVNRVRDFLPEPSRRALQQRFEAAVLLVERSAAAVRAALQVAIDVREEVDMSALFTDLAVAAEALRAVVDQMIALSQPAPGTDIPRASYPSFEGLDLLDTEVARLRAVARPRATEP